MSFWSEILLSDIATAHPRLQNNIHSLSSQTILHNKFVYRNDKQLAFPWKSLCIPQKAYNFELGRIHRWRGRLVIKAVATLEPTRLNQRSKEFNLKFDVDSGSSTVSNGVGQESSSEDSTELNDREKLRRMRISKANKGNTPWNKGKKHSPETLQRIRERTRLAMQDPKVKMKLVNLGHAQSEETRMKIGIGVRIGWEKRREMLMLQETCVYEWQNLIAEASRRGILGEEELQWNSYKILDKQLEQEWVQSVEERKRTPRVKGSKRAPKSLEQRRKISESISAKWADPSYRNRVCSALAKYHGITEGVERKPRRKPSAVGQTRKRSPLKKKVDSDDFEKPEPRSQIQRLKRSSVASYKDPLASTKLEMLKNIRAQRAAAESKKTEAISRAKVLIAEAEKAARALEVAAKTSPLAQVSLVETRKLIAEAIQSVSSIEEGQEDSQPDGNISLASPELVAHSELTMSANFEDPNQIIERKVNGYGSQTLASSDCDFMRFNFEKPALQDLVDASSNSDSIGFNFEKPPLQDLEAPSSNADPMELNFERPPQQDLLDCTEKLEPSSPINHDLVNGKENTHQTRPSDYSVAPTLLNNGVKRSSFTQHLGDLELNGSIDRADSAISNGVESQSSKEEKPPKSATVTKKWVRGRLVEVDDGSLG